MFIEEKIEEVTSMIVLTTTFVIIFFLCTICPMIFTVHSVIVDGITWYNILSGLISIIFFLIYISM